MMEYSREIKSKIDQLKKQINELYDELQIKIWSCDALSKEEVIELAKDVLEFETTTFRRLSKHFLITQLENLQISKAIDWVDGLNVFTIKHFIEIFEENTNIKEREKK